MLAQARREREAVHVGSVRRDLKASVLIAGTAHRLHECRRTGVLDRRRAPIETGDRRVVCRRPGGEENRGGDRLRPHSAAISSRPISMRRISLVPAPISISLASRKRRDTGESVRKPAPPMAWTAWWAWVMATSEA